MFTAAFAKATAERALKTFVQAIAAVLVADGFDLVSTNWAGVLLAAATAAIASVGTSIVSAAATDSPGPSLTEAEVLVDPVVDHG